MRGPVAHLNVAYLRAGRGAPEVAEFWDNTDRVNMLASRWPGFIANIGFDDAELARAAPLFAELPAHPKPTRLIATLSAWATPGDLHDFTTRGVHGRFRDRRAEWFVPLSGATYVVWPVAPGHLPTMAEALDRLAAIRADGPSSTAYDFKWLNENTETA